MSLAENIVNGTNLMSSADVIFKGFPLPPSASFALSARTQMSPRYNGFSVVIVAGIAASTAFTLVRLSSL